MADLYGRSTNDTINGTSGDDTIFGRSGNDTLNGGAGSDSLYGGSGNDVLNGGSGDDVLSGGSGADVLRGGSGADVIQGDGGDDELHGGSGADILNGGSSDDTLYGDAGSDALSGGAGDDALIGGAGNDLLAGGAGDDVLDGGSGNDILDGGSGDNVITGGAGADIVQVTDPGGTLVITDFDPTADKLDLTALAKVGSLDELSIVQSGDSVLITSDSMNGSITIRGATVDEVTAPGVIAVACFVGGTLVRTSNGDIPIETLVIGDLVTTGTGSRPVKWIGRRAFSRRFAERSAWVVPVRVRASALADGVPSRDLLISPEHALYVEGVLVPAGHLVNGTTIVRDASLDIIAYYHVEFETHDVIICNGTLAETYVDHGNRKMFANWPEYVDLYGDVPPIGDAGIGRVHPTVDDGPDLDRIRAQVDARAARRSGRAA